MIKRKNIMLQEEEKFTFFWSGPFSQWHKCSFTVREITYNCTEQYMMAQKALLFNDESTYNEIMAESNPRAQKKLGRKIQGFSKDIWDEHRYSIVLAGNIAKFSQDQQLNAILMFTGLTTIVEASPVDNIWGIGLAETTRDGDAVLEIYDRSKWKGLNLLGQVLTQVRETFKADNIRKYGIALVK
jgi:hypothetical protein